MSLLERAKTDPDGLALDDLERQRSWAEVLDRATRLSNVLSDEFGVEPGSHIAQVMGNRVEFMEVVLAATLAGATITPVNWHLTADEIRYIMDDSGSLVLLADPEFAGNAKAATERPVVVAGEELDGLIAGASDRPFDPDRPAGGTMLYTSGTTGRPKGVRRRAGGATVGQTLEVGGLAAGFLGFADPRPHLVTGPLYHASPLGFGTIAWHSDSPLVLMRKWDPSTNLRLIMEHQVAHLHMVPIMFVRSLRLPEAEREAFDPSSLVTVLHGAAPVSITVKKQMIDWWGPVITEYWGSTEGGVFTLVSSEEWLERPGTVGKPTAGYEVFAVDDDGKRLDPGEVGVLYCRNQRQSERSFEYHNAPEKTEEAWLEDAFTNGDVGYVDDDGYVFLSDRASDMIISGGVNIYPAEIETELIEHPAVADVAVFGIPDEEWGESVKAAIELADGVEPAEELEREILTWARSRMAGYKVPRSIDFHDELPRHPTGKLYKRLLRDRYWQREGRMI